MNEICSNLDSYLLGDLSPAEEAAFIEHLNGCDDCREAVDEQRWIDGLLQSSSQLETEVPPPLLVSELRVVAARRDSTWKRTLTIALATAAALFIAVTWLLNQHSGNSAERVAKTNDVSAVPQAPHAQFVAGNDTIAVPIESRHPHVTIIRLYSTFHPTDNSKMAAFEPEATNLNSSTDFSNGG